eukprot:CAMPEP_0114413780 /NCGR_PEP_ID=MMETSP0103-20121206/1036_1 /TAXON_ID=37642 ORGANISM="Paraphysomonas imperforata, Strain PA2" /NCGR_SAMPLE_ID=MMETSP0103 /ASSEMBLY_ACC=CAM_ASM_000201 /LENGTH=360 /DNA_ID=CAMNT_0001581875 /DNA_START=220 /DNA_END=1302 /DNA_ORIENTATION=-
MNDKRMAKHFRHAKKKLLASQPLEKRPKKTYEKGSYYYHFYKSYLSGCDVDEISYYDFMEANRFNNTEVVLYYLEPGTVFNIQVWDMDPETWMVAELNEVFKAFGKNRNDFILIHAADESNHYNNTKLIEFYETWRRVYRHNWWDTAQFNRLNKENKLHWFPYSHLRSPELEPEQFIPSSRRSLNITFRANRYTNIERVNNTIEVEEVIGENITGMIFKSHLHSQDPSKNETYLREMLNSKFCLSMKGRTPECHRLYESLECGCIPVFIDNYKNASYLEQFAGWKSKLEEVSWRKGHILPFIWEKNVESFRGTYDRLVKTGDAGLAELDVIQQETIEWWAAAKQHFKKHVEQAICSIGQV